MRLAVGPLLYLWERAAVFEFYESLAAAPVDIVYLGEVVCAKRRELGLKDWIAIGRRLADSGKEVVLSTLALIEAESELAALSRIAADGGFLVEANDVAAVEILDGRPFVAGPHLNLYNAQALALMLRRGACRWAPPLELSLEVIAAIRAGSGRQVPVEVFAFGRMPLAFSARCFTARYQQRAKDDCGFVCAQYADGLTLSSREGAPFLALNGIQTQSAAVQNVLGSLPAIAAAGVDVLRLSPQSRQFPAVVAAFRGALEGAATAAMPEAALPGGYCDGFLRGMPGMRAAQS